MEYQDFISQREYKTINAGFEPDQSQYPSAMFDHQRAVVSWACRRGRAGVFMDTGLGKTITQLTWADQVQKHTGGFVLLLAPLAVAHQTEREAEKFGLNAKFVSSENEVTNAGIYITNYEKLHHFESETWAGVVLDESSILKGMMGKVREQITEFFSETPYRLSCTATPSPNDFMELGTQSEFLGIMSQLEMLAMFFIHDTAGTTTEWRLKGHGKYKFWEWLSTWCVFMRYPSDIGFASEGYELPPVEMHSYEIITKPAEGQLFAEPAQSLQERNAARRETVEERCKKAAEIVNSLDGDCIVWCNLNDESDMLSKLIPGSIEVRGSDSEDHKVNAVKWFTGDDSFDIIGKTLVKKGNPKCGSQNIQKIEIESTVTTQSIEKKEKNRQEIQKRKNSTSRNIQKEIQISSGEHLSSKLSITQEEELGTLKIKNTETQSRKLHPSIKNLTQKEGLPKGSRNTESHQMITEPCCQLKEADAQYAEVKILDAQKRKDYTSIIVTRQEESEGFFAPTAIKELVNSKTTQRYLGEQPATSKKVLISKPRIFGYGINFQSSHHCVFVGLSDSWESYYQAIRRQWRFGQKETVHCHVISADVEGAVVDNIRRKDEQHKELSIAMMEQMRDFMKKEVLGAAVEVTDYEANQDIQIPIWLVTKNE